MLVGIFALAPYFRAPLNEPARSSMSALAAFRIAGDGKGSRAQLARVPVSNRHVPAFALGTKQIPKRLPPYCSPGEADEAI